jgi:hypothetical protein
LPLIVKDIKIEQNVLIQNWKRLFPWGGNSTLHQAEESLNSRKPTHRQGCHGGRRSYFNSEMPEKNLLGKNKASAIGLHNRRQKKHYNYLLHGAESFLRS